MTFIIFGSAVLAIIFFILGIFFKVVTSALDTLISSIGKMLAIGGLGGLVAIAIFLLAFIIEESMIEGFWPAIGMTVVFILVAGFIISIVGGIGIVILDYILSIVLFVLEFIFSISTKATDMCEKLYTKSMKVIIDQLAKC